MDGMRGGGRRKGKEEGARGRGRMEEGKDIGEGKGVRRRKEGGASINSIPDLTPLEVLVLSHLPHWPAGSAEYVHGPQHHSGTGTAHLGAICLAMWKPIPIPGLPPGAGRRASGSRPEGAASTAERAHNL